MRHIIVSNPYRSYGKWFKGETHFHTSLKSKRAPPPWKMIRAYRENKFDFVVKTDHNVFHAELCDEMSNNNFLCISGIELRCNADKEIVFYPYREEIISEDEISVISYQEAISKVLKNSSNTIVQIAHPLANGHLWTIEEIIQASKLGANLLEIHPRSYPIEEILEVWDTVLCKGIRLWGVIANDAHGIYDETPERFGHILVNSPRLDESEIIKNIRMGNFVSVEKGFEGMIEKIIVENNVIVIKSTGSRVEFHGSLSNGRRFQYSCNEENCYYHVTGKEKYVRVVIYDHKDKRIFLQPMFISSTK